MYDIRVEFPHDKPMHLGAESWEGAKLVLDQKTPEMLEPPNYVIIKKVDDSA